jgi:hypothetical protein
MKKSRYSTNTSQDLATVFNYLSGGPKNLLKNTLEDLIQALK